MPSRHMNRITSTMSCALFVLLSDSMEWKRVPCDEAPPRNSHAAVLYGSTIIIIGGASPEGHTDDVHTIDLSDMSALSCRQVTCESAQTGAPHSEALQQSPSAREMHSANLVSRGKTKDADPTILVMGGRSAAGVHQDLFALNPGEPLQTLRSLKSSAKTAKAQKGRDISIQRCLVEGTVDRHGRCP